MAYLSGNSDNIFPFSNEMNPICFRTISRIHCERFGKREGAEKLVLDCIYVYTNKTLFLELLFQKNDFRFKKKSVPFWFVGHQFELMKTDMHFCFLETKSPIPF